MNHVDTTAANPTVTPRYSDVKHQKSSGATYTPANFATFLAKQILRVCDLPKEGIIRVLDPACGDGALLGALLSSLSPTDRARVFVTGYDINPVAVQLANTRLQDEFPEANVRVEQRDFLEYVLEHSSQEDFLQIQPPPQFHIVIANPPYVRTQIMGSEQAKSLASKFGLTGRVDLYYPFLLSIANVLEDGGVMGVITSNRFMTTKSGQAVRSALLSRFQILHAWDLGDTKLFDAAVLPSVLLARGQRNKEAISVHSIAYSSIYQTQEIESFHAPDVLSALEAEDNTIVSISDGRRFHVRHGVLDNGQNSEGVWRVATALTDQWLATVERYTWNSFRRIGKIRVGVKSTADKVFIRSDWNNLPDGRPELLRPLITRKCARRFKSQVPERADHRKEILYPHEISGAGRSASDLNNFPVSAKYLAQHRAALEARTYLIEAGRKWYELWVPHDPALWSFPKLVFPDISDKPIFWMDLDGGIVNGECYWLTCERPDEEDLLWLALAVANSSFIEEYYDHRFNNKLYAGRRRFITQYVEQFPLPDPSHIESVAIISLAKTIYSETPSVQSDSLAIELDRRIWGVFGLPIKESRG